jgi:hypothetical protein
LNETGYINSTASGGRNLKTLLQHH